MGSIISFIKSKKQKTLLDLYEDELYYYEQRKQLLNEPNTKIIILDNDEYTIKPYIFS